MGLSWPASGIYVTRPKEDQWASNTGWAAPGAQAPVKLAPLHDVPTEERRHGLRLWMGVHGSLVTGRPRWCCPTISLAVLSFEQDRWSPTLRVCLGVGGAMAREIAQQSLQSSW